MINPNYVPDDVATVSDLIAYVNSALDSMAADMNRELAELQSEIDDMTSKSNG